MAKRKVKPSVKITARPKITRRPIPKLRIQWPPGPRPWPPLHGSSCKDTPDPAMLGPLELLMGSWHNQKNALLGYNVMPLPEIGAPGNIILKNFHYYETMNFDFIGKVPNRGGAFEQNCYGLLYEQRVFFSEFQCKGHAVHAENGIWLHLATGDQTKGPYGGRSSTTVLASPPAPHERPTQDKARCVAKQVSVPHGNSMLCLGTCETIDGPPTIPDIDCVPHGAPSTVQNKYRTTLDRNPNAILQQQLKKVKVKRTTILRVSTDNGGGLTNVPFIRNHANVGRFETTFWIEELTDGKRQLQYSQNAVLELATVDGNVPVPHVTANTLTEYTP